MCEREQEELMIKSQINPNLKFYQKFISFLINLINIEYVINTTKNIQFEL